MKRSLAAVTGIIAFGAAPSWAVGPSFDCSRALDPLAQTICGDPGLSRLDIEFNQAYQALREQVGAYNQAHCAKKPLIFKGRPSKGAASNPFNSRRHFHLAVWHVWTTRMRNSGVSGSLGYKVPS